MLKTENNFLINDEFTISQSVTNYSQYFSRQNANKIYDLEVSKRGFHREMRIKAQVPGFASLSD